MMLPAERIGSAEPDLLQCLIQQPGQRLWFTQAHQTAQCALAVGSAGVYKRPPLAQPRTSADQNFALNSPNGVD
jgi:hypothetical protein